MSWSRPCFRGFASVVMGDSSIRAFGRKRKQLRGMSITGFGGLDILEAICLLQAGKMSKDCDIGRCKIRNRFQVGKDEFPTIRFCKHCYGECMSNFEGRFVLVVGLNNTLKADREPFANEYGRSLQDIEGMFALLDTVLGKMLPKAQIKLAPVLNVESEAWRRSSLKQEIFNRINNCILEREHLQMDPNEPFRRNLYDPDGVHMHDYQSIEFWTKILMQDLENQES